MSLRFALSAAVLALTVSQPAMSQQAPTQQASPLDAATPLLRAASSGR